MTTIASALAKRKDVYLLVDLDFGAYRLSYAKAGINVPEASSSGTIDAVAPDGLVGYWSLDEGTGTTTFDGSGNGNDGTLVGGPTWVDGISGKALSFDGVDDYVSVADDSSLNFGTGDFTISTWFKTSTVADYRNLFYKGAAAGLSGWRFGLRDDGIPYILIGDTSVYKQGVVASTSFADGLWHHFVAVFDRSSYAKGYVDGQYQGQVDISAVSGSVDNTSDVMIGRSYDRYAGLIDEVRIYNRALSQGEIENLYNNPSGKMSVTIPKSRHYAGKLKSISRIGPTFDLSGPRYSASQVSLTVVNDTRIQDLEPRISWADAVGTVRVWTEGLYWEDIEDDGIIFKGLIKKNWHNLTTYGFILDNYTLSRLQYLPGKKFRIEDISTIRTEGGSGPTAGKDIPLIFGSWPKGVPLYTMKVWDSTEVTYSPGIGIASSLPHVYNKDGVELTSGVTKNTSHVFPGGWIGPYVVMTTNYTSSEPHSCAIDMMEDDDNGTFTGTAGQLIENPADIVRYLLVRYSDLESDEVNLASLGSMRSLLAPAKYATIINQGATGKDILDRLCSQAWCAVLTRRGKLDFVTFDLNMPVKGMIDLDTLSIGIPQISWDSAGFENNIQVQYKLNPTTKAWEGNITYDRTNNAQCRASAERFGEQETFVLQVTDAQLEATARQMAQRFIDFRCEPHDIVTANLEYHAAWDYDEGDVAGITLAAAPGGWTEEPCILIEKGFTDHYIMTKWMRIATT